MKTLTKYFLVETVDTALYIGSGGLEVLATPTMIEWMENVAYTLCSTLTEEGVSTVGIELDVHHIAPTAVGEQVKIDVDIKDRHRSIITLYIEATVNGELVGSAKHKRAIVNNEKFLTKLSE